jgi:glycosyltransferase involved in cell wall biosynthesis
VPVAATTRVHANELSTPTILEVADAGRLKNVKSLLEAMPAVIADYPGAKLRLAGHGLTSQSPLARLAGRLGVADNVDFLGRVGPAELGLLYRQADLFVHASIEEACPMSVAEAMSYQLPVIGGRRAGGIPWLLDQGQAGLLVDVKRPDAIASGVLGLLEDDHLRRQMGSVAQERVRAHFSPQTVSDGYLEAYARAEGKS